MPVIVGAGSVGLALAAQLARSGADVLLVTRRENAAEGIRREGVLAEDPASGETTLLPADAVAGLAAAGRQIGSGIGSEPVFLCTRTYQAETAGRALARHAPHAVAVCLCNGLTAEADVARHAARVVGGVWRQTCTRVADHHVRFQGRARVVLGGFSGEDASTAAVQAADLLRQAGLDVGLSTDILSDKWLKLCVNLMSAPNALIERPDHRSAAFVEVKARLLEEAQAALAAAGVAARSCDGRDRSIAEEIAQLRASFEAGSSARDLPLHNSVWSALRQGLPLEALEYHQRILDLAERHGLPAPTNARVLAALARAHASGAGPESLRAAALLP